MNSYWHYAIWSCKKNWFYLYINNIHHILLYKT
jgi:hypothetical protein